MQIERTVISLLSFNSLRAVPVFSGFTSKCRKRFTFFLVLHKRGFELSTVTPKPRSSLWTVITKDTDTPLNQSNL